MSCSLHGLTLNTVATERITHLQDFGSNLCYQSYSEKKKHDAQYIILIMVTLN